MTYLILVFTLVIIAVIGIILISLIFARLQQLNKINKLNTFKRTEEGVSDLLLYSSVVDNGIIQLKNGGLMAAYSYEGEDNSNLTAPLLELLSSRINHALSNLGNGWSINVDSVRVQCDKYSDKSSSFFPDVISAAIDEERRQFFQNKGLMFEGRNFITFTYLPPNIAQTKFIDLMYDEDEEYKNSQSKSSQILDYFKQQLDNIESALSSSFKMKRLGYEEYIHEDGSIHKYDTFLSFIQYCITGNSQPIILPETPLYLDLLLGGEDLITGITPKVGDKFIGVVAIDGFPAESYPSILSALSDIDITCRYSTRYICMEPFEAEGIIKKEQSKWQQKRRGMISMMLGQPDTATNVNHDADAMVLDANEALSDLKGGYVNFGYYTANVILMEENKDLLEEKAKYIKKMLMNIGFVARIETINTLEAYLGSLPGHNIPNIRRFFINTLNLADLIPTSTIWTGKDNAPCPFYGEAPALMHCVTEGATPYRLNLHVKDVGHTIILGPTGAGKSTLLALIAAQALRYQKAQIFAFDKGMSLFALCSAVNGSHFEIGDSTSNLCFAPFNYMETEGDKAFLIDWIQGILVLNDVQVTTVHINEISQAIQSLSKKSGNVSFTDFIGQLQSSELREALKQYDVSGTMGFLFSAKEDSLSFSKFNVYEIEQLLNFKDKYVLPVLDYLFRRIELRLDGSPSFIFIDEAWITFKHPHFAPKIVEWLKVLRKKNCALIMATQSLSDAANSESSALIGELIQSTASKIFLPNPMARANEDFMNLYKKFGLNERQIDIIASGIPKCHYYHFTIEGARQFELAIGKFALAFVAVSDPEKINEIKKLKEMYNEEWVKYWLEYNNISNLGRLYMQES